MIRQTVTEEDLAAAFHRTTRIPGAVRAKGEEGANSNCKESLGMIHAGWGSIAVESAKSVYNNGYGLEPTYTLRVLTEFKADDHKVKEIFIFTSSLKLFNIAIDAVLCSLNVIYQKQFL